MEKIKGEIMTQAEEIRELRNWLRNDAEKNDERERALHKKIDENNTAIHLKIDVVNDKVGAANTEIGINKVKIGLYVTLLTTLVAAMTSGGFQHLVG